MIRSIVLPLAAACCVLLAACQQNEPATPAEEETAASVEATKPSGQVPGTAEETAPFNGIAEDETLRFTGTEPFWGGEVTGKTLTYTTPEDPNGKVIAVERFAGRGGIAYGGLLEGADFDMMVTPLACSDGMSDRTYPFTVTLGIGDDKRNGCGWSDEQPFEGPRNP